MLTRVCVDNFKCMVNFECRLGSPRLILGANGSGKSTLFDVFTLLRDFCARGEPGDDRFLGSTLTRWGGNAEQTFELTVEGNGGEYTMKLVVDSWGRPARPRVLREEVDFNGKPIFRFVESEVGLYNDKLDGRKYVHFTSDWHRSALATVVTERPDNKKLMWFKRWLASMLLVSPDPRRMSGVASQEVRNPDQHLSNFADWYRHLRQEETDAAYMNDLREVIEGFVSMRLEDAGDRRREIKIRMAPVSNGAAGTPEWECLLSEMSDGQRVLIGLYAVLHFAIRNGATVCFDEPDNFIALSEIQPWLARLLAKAEDEPSPAQVLIASHHPEVLNRMAFKEGLLLERPDGRHVRARPFADAAETGLSAAELVARGWERE